MDYEEFLWALNDTSTYTLLEKCFKTGQQLTDAVHRRLLRQFRLYMLVGGMPQAVSEYINANSFKKVDEAKRDILNLYEADLAKIDPGGGLALLFNAIPGQLNKNASRFQASSLLGGEKRDNILEMIAQLKDSKTVLVSYNVNDPNTGLPNTKDLSRFKMFLNDTGLFVTLMFKNKAFTENEIYEKLLNDKLSVNLGYLYENIVAQTLTAAGNELFYHTIPNETSKHNYEVDFILERKNKIVPIEVKSSGYKTHRSLDVFTEKFSGRIAKRYLVYTKNMAKDGDVLCVPVYMAAFI